MTTLSIGFCVVPILLLIKRKMRLVKTYWFLGVYWLFNALVNIPPDYVSSITGSHSLAKELNFCYVLLEAPLLLLVFACSSYGRLRKQLLIVLSLFAAGELAVMRIKGPGFFSTSVIMGVGVALILTFSITGLLRYMRKMEHTPFEHSMAFVYAALLFDYGSYLIIFVFAHVHAAAGNKSGNSDSFLLYYASLLLSAAITSLGLWSFGFRTAREEAPPVHYTTF
jgi:hypothetical protein